MHERSLVKTLIDQVINEAIARSLGKIHGIQLQIGEFSGVEPRLVSSAFEEMAIEYWDNRVQLQIDVAPLTATCRSCDTAFQITEFRFICPKCGTRDLTITAGEETRLISISAEFSYK